jgi:hypothetical protein
MRKMADSSIACEDMPRNQGHLLQALIINPNRKEGEDDLGLHPF